MKREKRKSEEKTSAQSNRQKTVRDLIRYLVDHYEMDSHVEECNLFIKPFFIERGTIDPLNLGTMIVTEKEL